MYFFKEIRFLKIFFINMLIAFLLSFVSLTASQEVTSYDHINRSMQVDISNITSQFTTVVDNMSQISHNNYLSRTSEQIDDSIGHQKLRISEGRHGSFNLSVLSGNGSTGEAAGITWEKVEGLLKSRTKSALEWLTPMDAVRRTNASDSCKSGLEKYFDSLSNLETWSIQMADASGTIAGGVLKGRVQNLGSFDECLSVHVNSKMDKVVEDFRGQFCMVYYSSPLLRNIFLKNGSLNQQYQEKYGEPPEWLQDFIFRAGPYLKHLSFSIGTCVPSTCSDNDLKQIITHVTSPLEMDIEVKGCQVEKQMAWSKSLIAAVSALGTLAILCILGTASDILNRISSNQLSEDVPEDKSKCFSSKLLNTFSVISNIKILLNKDNSKSFGCLDGLRVLSMAWIVAHHSIGLQWGLEKYKNFLALEDDFNGFFTKVFFDNGHLAVSSFFFLSGFLMSYSLWRKLEMKKENVNFFKYFLHKYWRLTPAFALTLAVFIVVAHIGSGPLWSIVMDPLAETCYFNSWRNFIYISNWWPGDEICLPHTWYISSLMQFHIIGFILIQLTFRYHVVGIIFGLIILLGCGALVVSIVILKKYHLPFIVTEKDFDALEWIEYLYYKPYYHIPSYIVGMVAGYLVLKYKDQKIKLRYQSLCWILSIIGNIYAVYGLHERGNNPVSVIFYFAVSFTAWSASLGWLTYACISGCGGVINRILSWKAFHLFSDISYVLYLLHFVVLCYDNASLKEPLNYGKYDTISSFFSLLVISIFLAFIGHVTVEMPFTHLEKFIF